MEMHDHEYLSEEQLSKFRAVRILSAELHNT